MTLPPTGRLVCCGIAIALLAGCGPKEEIRSYTVPKPEPEGGSGGKYRLLGAIIPVGDGQSRFVKSAGPADKIDAVAPQFDTFVKSIRVTDPAKPVVYTVPEGWRPGPAKQMRVVTFLVGPPEKPAEVYISDPFGGSLLDNVNRWRNEAGLPKITEEELPASVTEVDLGGVKSYKVDFQGPGGKTGMSGMPPFAGGR